MCAPDFPTAGRVRRQPPGPGREHELRESATRLLRRHLNLKDLLVEVRIGWPQLRLIDAKRHAESPLSFWEKHRLSVDRLSFGTGSKFRVNVVSFRKLGQVSLFKNVYSGHLGGSVPEPSAFGSDCFYAHTA